MPELPEVETLKRCLEQSILYTNITNFSKRRDTIRYQLSDSLESNVKFAKILTVRRRAKYLLIDLDNGYSVIVHLGMTGRFTLQNSEYNATKHDHVIFILDNSRQLVFNDYRRFGMIYTMLTSSIEQQFLQNLGVEPLSSDMSNKYLQQKLNRNIPIKNLLMDNRIVVGVGNIYASESLFLARILPTRPGNKLSEQDIDNLISAIQDVLTKAISAGGTTLKDFVSGDSKPGYFQQELQVYARENQSCRRCKGIIRKIKQSGRSSFYCSICQV
jgi:formamidopyrimidine-DNA glycosylase